MTQAPAHLARPLATRTLALPDAPLPAPAATETDAILQAGAQALADGRTHYTDRPGIGPLRDKLAAWTAPLGITADQFTITCGVEEARYVALRTLAPAGGRVLVLGDSAPIANVAALLQLELVTQAFDVDDGMAPLLSDAAYSQALAEAGTCRAIYAVGLYTLMRFYYLNLNASGAEMRPAHPLPPWAICELPDPAYELEVGDSEQRQVQRMAMYGAPNDAPAKTVYIGGLPEMEGWRVGFMAGSSAAGKLRAFKQSMTICTPSVSQWAALGIEEARL